jgi:hypothetical protein
VKKILVAIVITLISTAGCRKKADDQHAKIDSDAAGKAVANTALQVSELDVSALSGVTEKIKSVCARNKYGLSEEACIQTIEDRKGICMQQTAQKYPGQLANVERMQEVVASHVGCLFQK